MQNYVLVKNVSRDTIVCHKITTLIPVLDIKAVINSFVWKQTSLIAVILTVWLTKV